MSEQPAFAPSAEPELIKPIGLHIHRPFWAALMSLVQIGWGQFYNGQVCKAAVVFAAAQAASVVAALLAARSGQPLYLALIVIPVYAFAAFEAWIKARALGPLHERWVPRWYWHLAFVAAAALLDAGGYVAINATLIKYSKIPSTSMLPTLTVMDVIMVDRTAYLQHPPERGDVVVFRPPATPKEEWVKRVIAIGGDSVSFDPAEGVLRVNSAPQTELPLGAWNPGLCGEAQHEYQRFRVSAEWGEYEILRRPDFNPEGRYEFHVPAGELFLMGDNRDMSLDSRIIGTIPANNVVGRAAFIYTSFDMCQPLPLPIPRPDRTLRRL